MRARKLVVLSVLALALGGCAASGPVGTWSGRDSDANTPFSFGSVSFVGDNTFTAEARYGGTTRVQSGTWSTTGNQLHLTSGNTKREYTYTTDGKVLTVTEPKSGRSIALDRMPR